MATKAGRVTRKDFKVGKTFWKAEIHPETGERYPAAVQIIDGMRLGRFKRPDQTPVAMWWYAQRSIDRNTGEPIIGRIVCDPMWSPTLNGEPVFDKLFVNRAAAVRWIRRYQTDRVETLCEDRRIFETGSQTLRTIASWTPDQLNLRDLPDHRFQHAELAACKHYGFLRHAKLNDTPHG